MANFTSVLDRWLFSRLVPRRVDTRPRIVGVLVAAVAFISAFGPARPRFEGPFPEWNDARAVQALPSLHSLALHRAAHAPRLQRRQSSHPDIPLTTDASLSFASTLVRGIAPSVARPRPAAAVVARGYDATAPPVS